MPLKKTINTASVDMSLVIVFRKFFFIFLKRRHKLKSSWVVRTAHPLNIKIFLSKLVNVIFGVIQREKLIAASLFKKCSLEQPY